jgi:CheY-like chemotaxis protein
MDGFKVVRELRQIPVTNIFMAALTGYGTHDDKVLPRKAALMNTSQNQLIPTLLFNLISQSLALRTMKSD